jgi:hypothetical protein
MAFPTVIAVHGGNSTVDQTSVTVNLPDGSDVAGRLLLVFFTSDGNGETFTFPAGFPWTEILVEGGAGFTQGVWFRGTTGTEGYPATGATITVTISSTEQSCHTSYLLSGHHASTNPVTGGIATGTDDAPNPGALNPADWDVEDTLWFACCGYNGPPSTVNAYPSSYTNGRSDVSTGGNGCGQGVARRENATASEDAGAFTLSAAIAWRAATVGVRPAAAAAAANPPKPAIVMNAVHHSFNW